MHEFSEILKMWTPFLSIGVLLWRGFTSAKTGIENWAHELLTNHLHHLQAALDEQTKLLRQLVEKK